MIGCFKAEDQRLVLSIIILSNYDPDDTKKAQTKNCTRDYEWTSCFIVQLLSGLGTGAI